MVKLSKLFIALLILDGLIFGPELSFPDSGTWCSQEVSGQTNMLLCMNFFFKKLVGKCLSPVGLTFEHLRGASLSSWDSDAGVDPCFNLLETAKEGGGDSDLLWKCPTVT